MTETLRWIEQSLKGIYPENEIRCFSRILLEKIGKIPPHRQLIDKDRQLSGSERAEIRTIVERLKNAEPIQYILGETDFYGLTFHVAPGVLIPRPETEELTEHILSRYQKGDPPEKILDIGTGSGCIAVTLAKYLPDTEVTAVDISPDALAIARRNAEKHNVRVHFIQTDILCSEAPEKIHETYSLIVSNPPYVKRSEKKDMESNVLEYEPHTALFVPDDDPLLFYRAIARFGIRRLKKNGFLYLEINAQYGKETMELLQDESYRNIRLIRDLSGKDRIIEAQR